MNFMLVKEQKFQFINNSVPVALRKFTAHLHSLKASSPMYLLRKDQEPIETGILQRCLGQLQVATHPGLAAISITDQSSVNAE